MTQQFVNVYKHDSATVKYVSTIKHKILKCVLLKVTADTSPESFTFLKLINAFKNNINKNGGPVAVRGAEQARAEGAGFAASYSRAPEVQSVHMSLTPFSSPPFVV